MRKLIFLVLLFLSFSLLGQTKIDSLENTLPKLDGPEKAAAFNQLSKLYLESDSANSFSYARKALSLGRSINDQEVIATAFFNLAEAHYQYDEFKAALADYEKSLSLYKELSNDDKVGEVCNSMGLAHYFLGEYDLALEKQIEALKILEKTNDIEELAHVYSNVGMVYSRLSNYRMSIANYRKASVLNFSINDLYSVAVNYNGIGVGYYNMGMLDSAKINYSIALDYFRKTDNQRRVAIGLNNIANIYVDEGDSLDKALDYYNQAFRIFEEQGDVRNTAFVMEGLGCAYRKMGQYQQALNVFNEGLEVARTHRLGYYIQQLYYKDIAETNELLGMIPEAFAAFKMYKTYQDSLHQEERMKQVTSLEKRYENEKKEAEIARLSADRELTRLQLQKDRVVRLFGLIVILLLLVIIVYVSVSNYNKHRTNQLLNEKNRQIEKQKNELELLNKSKNKFFSIIAHDIKNPLHIIKGYSFVLNKEYCRFSDEQRQKYAGDIYNSSNNLFRLLQNLLDWSRSQTGRIKYEPVTFDISQLYERIFHLMNPLAEQKNIVLTSNIPEQTLVYADPMMVDTILRNLINNAIKFSNPGLEIMTDVKHHGEFLQINVADQGVGMTKEEVENLFRIDSKVKNRGTNDEDGTGLGLVLCKEFVQINKGDIWVESKPALGSIFSFTIPAANGER